MNHDSSYGDEVSSKLIPTASFDHPCLSPSMTTSSVVLQSLVEPSDLSSKPIPPARPSALLRSQSVPLLDFSTDQAFEPVPLSESSRQRTSFGSHESGDSAIQDEETVLTPHTPSDHYTQELTHHHTFVMPAHRSGFNILSSSLPASSTAISRPSTTHEHATRELLRLTQPLREGVLSRERLLPATRLKQIGVARRGQRHSSLAGTTRPPLLLSPGLLTDPTPDDHLPNAIPLLAPRPIRAWQADQT